MGKYVLYLIFIIVIGIVFYLFASRRGGANPTVWFFRGVGIGLITLIIGLFAEKHLKDRK